MTSYSQYEEDRIYVPLLPQHGRLMEIGAYHPMTFSNSRALIERGWSALLIDPSPYAVQSLLDEYGRMYGVTIVQAAVSVDVVALAPIMVSRDAVSSGNSDTIKTWEKDGAYVGWIQAATLTIPEISNQFGGFDFVSIDAEGFSVPLAIEFLKLGHRPQILMVEHDSRFVELAQAYEKAGYVNIHQNGTNMVLRRA